MSIKISPNSLYQWDTGKQLTITNVSSDISDINEVHFCNRVSDGAYVVPVSRNGSGSSDIAVDIPNELLQRPETLVVYLCSNESINESISLSTSQIIKIPVIPRQKPEKYDPASGVTYTTIAQVDSRIRALLNEALQVIGDATTLDIQVVETLPTQDISTTTIYLLPRSTSETDNLYDEYIYIANSWEKIGSTEIDISGKQDVLTAGSNITITNNTISAIDTTYSDATTSASGLMSSTDKAKLDGIASGAEANVQSNWNETDSSSDAYIQNKPDLSVYVKTDANQILTGITQWNKDGKNVLSVHPFTGRFKSQSTTINQSNGRYSSAEFGYSGIRLCTPNNSDSASDFTYIYFPGATNYSGIKVFATNDDIPTGLADLTADSTHRTVTDSEKSTWNGKEDAANKVTTIDTSSPSATEYPSESAVVSYVNGLIGDINTILDTINGEVI